MTPKSRSAPIGLSRGDALALRRVHVTQGYEWAQKAGTDFWLLAAANGILTASTQGLISDGGWTATSLSVADGSGADFGSKADPGTPGEITTNAGADLLKSPAIFGDYAHMHQAAVIAGMNSIPRYLVMDAYARLSTASADESTSNLGFVEAGGSIVTAADIQASFYSKGTGTTFNMNSNATVVTGLVAVDTSYHWFRILMDRFTGNSLYYVDGTYNGLTPITTDVFPVAWGFGNGTTDRWQLNQVHVFYDWTVPFNPAVF